MSNDKKHGYYFNAANTAAEAGKKGGYRSRRARSIKKDEPLKKDEMSELISLSGVIIDALGPSGYNIMTAADEASARVRLTELSGNDDWQAIFCGLTGKEIVDKGATRLAWKNVLQVELAEYQNKIDILCTLGVGLNEEDKNRFRIIRNLAKAFEISTGDIL